MNKLIFGVMALLFSVSANAICSKSDLSGTWATYSTGNPMALRLTFTIPKSNFVIPISVPASGFNADLTTQNNVMFEVSYFDKNCHLAGTVSVNNVITSSFDGYISKGKDSLSGLWGAGSGKFFQSGLFTGVKQ